MCAEEPKVRGSASSRIYTVNTADEKANKDECRR